MSHSAISPAILYWGTPVVLISTVNEDGTYNIAPMSSAWWLGTRCMLGRSGESQTTINLLRTKQCVLNLASDDMTKQVNALARTTGTAIVPPGKVQRGYRYVKDKFAASDLHPQPSEFVAPPRIRECRVQMEAELCNAHEFLDVSDMFSLKAIEVKILKTYVVDELRLPGHANRIDSDKWKPMIMMFSNLYGLRDGKADESVLARIGEESYRLPQEKPDSELEAEQ